MRNLNIDESRDTKERNKPFEIIFWLCWSRTEHVAWLENFRRLSSHAYILTLIRIEPLRLNPFAPFAFEIPRVPRAFHKIYIRKGGVLSHVPISRTPGDLSIRRNLISSPYAREIPEENVSHAIVKSFMVYVWKLHPDGISVYDIVRHHFVLFNLDFKQSN